MHFEDTIRGVAGPEFLGEFIVITSTFSEGGSTMVGDDAAEKIFET